MSGWKLDVSRYVILVEDSRGFVSLEEFDTHADYNTRMDKPVTRATMIPTTTMTITKRTVRRDAPRHPPRRGATRQPLLT